MYRKNSRKDGYDINVYYKEGPLDATTMSAADYAIAAKTQNLSREFFIVKSKGPDDVYYGIGSEMLFRSGRKVFPRTAYYSYILYRNGRVTVKKDGQYNRLVEFFIAQRKLEALTIHNDGSINADRQDDLLLLQALKNLHVLRDILRGSITNRKALIKAYMKDSWDVADFTYADIEGAFRIIADNGLSLADLRDYTTSLGGTLHMLAQYQNARLEQGYLFEGHNELQLFKDLLGDAVILDKRINPKWSKARMVQEHQSNIKRILEKELDAQDDTSIYDKAVCAEHEGYRFTAIDSPRAALAESKTMENCFFYNYWKNCVQRRYVGFHITSPEGEYLTLGANITRQDNKAVITFDQIHTYRNGWASEKDKKTALSFLEHFKQEILYMVSDINAAQPIEIINETDEFPF